MLLPSPGVTFSSQLHAFSSFYPLLSLCFLCEASGSHSLKSPPLPLNLHFHLYPSEAFFPYQLPVAISTSSLRAGPHSDRFGAWQLIFQKYLLDGGIRKLINVVEELT